MQPTPPGIRKQKATCKFCKKPIELEIDESCPVEWEKRLIPLGACDRCARFVHERRKIEDPIKANCIILCREHNFASRNHSEVMARVHDDLESLTQRYAELVARYYHLVDSLWDHDFVVQLMEKPWNWEKLLSNYRRAVYQHFKQMAKAVKQATGIP